MFAIAGIIGFIILCPYKWANVEKLRGLVKTVEAGELEQVDTKHIRQVSKEMAEWRGNQIIGSSNYGARFEVGNYSIQCVNNELYWVAPLEFRSWVKWWSAGTSPGFVMVSAEDPKKEARLVKGFKMKYMISSCFGSNLIRHIYGKGYMNCQITEFTFEVTDNLKPKWVVSVTKPTVGWTGDKVEGVVIVDPETGQMEFHKTGEVPDWVDRVIPEELAEVYNEWWGKYVNGWWNTLFSEKDISIPTTTANSTAAGNEISAPDVWLTYGNEGNPYWFTGHTSPSSEDRALVGFTMMDSRTGEMRFFSMTGANEDAVLKAVNNAVSNYAGWHSTQPILYNIYGELSWVVPVVGENNTFQRIAIVQASTSLVALGETKEKALIKFRQLIIKEGQIAPSASSHEKKLKGKISRINKIVDDGNTIFYIYLENEPAKIFTGTILISPELAIAREDDEVILGFLETEEEVLPFSSFDLPAVMLQKSKTQEEFEKLFEKREVKIKKNWEEQSRLKEKLRKLQEE